MNRRVNWAIPMAALVWTGSAIAQTGGADIAARRDLLQQAAAARAANDHARALDLAQRAGLVQMTPSLRMLIAQEQLALNAFADALGSGEQCVREADADASLRNRSTIRQTCQDIVTAAQPRVGRVTVNPPNPLPDGMVVTVNGNRLNPAFLGVPYVVTAGPVTVVATAPGRPEFRVQQAVNPGGTASVAVAFAATAASTTAVTSTTTTATTAETHVTPTEPATRSGETVSSPTVVSNASHTDIPPPSPPSHGGRSIAGPVAVIAVGAAGIIVGAIGLGLYMGDYNTLSMGCDAAGACNPSFAGTISEAGGFQVMSIVGFAVGGVAVAAGATWLALGSSHAEQSPARAGWHVVPWIGANGAGITIGGAL